MIVLKGGTLVSRRKTTAPLSKWHIIAHVQFIISLLENVENDNSANGSWHRYTESGVSPQPLQRVLLTHSEAISENRFLY
jgi:hypothetical protein